MKRSRKPGPATPKRRKRAPDASGSAGDFDRWLTSLAAKEESAAGVVSTDPAEMDLPIPEAQEPEIEIALRGGRPVQAGADAEGSFLEEFRRRQEENLFLFARLTCKKWFLNWSFHFPFCNSLQRVPPQRKLVLVPREHCKSTIVSQVLPLHVIIQPPKKSVWFRDGLAGREERIVLICETDTRACDHMRTLLNALETNKILRALWPDCVWAERRLAKTWNQTEFVIPRDGNYADPTVRALGVGSAITGQHPSVLIKDDLIALKASLQPPKMKEALEYHIATRALANNPRTLEFILGTRWAPGDIYEFMIKEDPTIEVIVRQVIEGGQPLYPELFPLEVIEARRAEFGERFFQLQFMNSASDPSNCDFSDTTKLRYYTASGDDLHYDWCAEDEKLEVVWGAKKSAANVKDRGRKLRLSDTGAGIRFEVGG